MKLESKVDLPFVVHSTYDDSDSDRLSEASEENHAESKRENNGTVVVSLVESTLGFDIDLRAEEKGQYVVEEASDDEEIAGEQKM